jgi:hypothetical protein
MEDLSTNKPEEQLLRYQMNHISQAEDKFTDITMNFSKITLNLQALEKTMYCCFKN